MAHRRQRTRRSPRISRRTAVVALCVAVVALYSVLVPIHATLYGTPLALAFLIGAGLCAAPLLALSHPRSSIAMFCAAAFALSLLVDRDLAVSSPWPWSVPALLTFVLFVGVVTFVSGVRLGAFPLVIGLAASLSAPLLRLDIVSAPGAAGSATADLIVTASVTAAALVIAALIAARMRVAEELTREREHSAIEESRRALVEERTRIARELHDVIAHSMSVIQVQASTARYRLAGIDDVAAAEFDDIATTARASLTEMRRMLGVLRTEDQSAELAPQQGISDIPALVGTIRRAGVDVGLAVEGGDAASSAPPAVQIAAFRIVQEALSNAVRHAPGSAVTVRVSADATRIRITVWNAPPASTPPDRGAGHGLRGMRERAELLGGTFSAAAAPDGGWTVEAELPSASDGFSTSATASRTDSRSDLVHQEDDS